MPELVSSHNTPGEPGSGYKAQTLVENRFSDIKNYGDNAVSSAESALATLAKLFTTASMPSTSISYAFQNIALESSIESKRPAAPTDEELTLIRHNVPQAPNLEGINLPNITIPEFTTPEPASEETNFSYSEIPYQSDLYDALKLVLIDFVNNGGTGLSATVEDAIWERAKARKDLENERVYNEAENYFASRGFTLPPGALAGRLTDALAEQTRANAQINYEIMIEQARLAQNNTQFGLDLSLKLEGVDKDQADKIANRAYLYAKDAVVVILEVYKAKVAAYTTRLQATEAEVRVAGVVAEIQSSVNKDAIAIYATKVDAYKTNMAVELSIVENVAKVYSYKIAGYEADAKVAEGLLNAQIKEYQGRIDQANNQTQLSIAEAKLVLENYLGALNLQLGAESASGNIASQLAASALSAVNASATLGYQVNRGRTDSVSYGQNLSESLSHTYSHTEGD